MTAQEKLPKGSTRRARRPYGYWDVFEHVEQELSAFLRELDADGYMPTSAVFVQSGRSDLLGAIQRHGGLILVATRLELKPWHRRAAATLEEQVAEQQSAAVQGPSPSTGGSTVREAQPSPAREVAQEPAAEPDVQQQVASPAPNRNGSAPVRYPRAAQSRETDRRVAPPRRYSNTQEARRPRTNAARDERQWQPKGQVSSPAGRSRMFRTRCRLCGREIFSQQRAVLTCADCGSRGSSRR